MNTNTRIYYETFSITYVAWRGAACDYAAHS